MTMWVAGRGALLAAKTHKIADRVGQGDRVQDKDALDLLRLQRAARIDELAARLHRLLDSALAGPVTEEALGLVSSLFGTNDADGIAMAVRPAGTAEDPATIAGSLVTLVDELRETLENHWCSPCAMRSGVTWFVTRNGVNPMGLGTWWGRRRNQSRK